MKSKPLVSVITPMYNSEKTIGKTIESIQNQTYDNFEILIIDDISTDNSRIVVEEYAEKDARIKYFKLEEKGGASIARNKGIKEAKGKYVSFLDADDTWFPNKLEIQISEMELQNLAFTYTNYEVWKDGKYLKTIKSPQHTNYKELLKSNKIGCLTVVYNSEIIKGLQIPKLDKRNDYALWLKALREGEEAYLVDQTLSTYYESDQSLSRSTSKIGLLKYHYQMFREILGYNFIVSIFLTIRNGVYNILP